MQTYASQKTFFIIRNRNNPSNAQMLAEQKHSVDRLKIAPYEILSSVYIVMFGTLSTEITRKRALVMFLFFERGL